MEVTWSKLWSLKMAKSFSTPKALCGLFFMQNFGQRKRQMSILVRVSSRPSLSPKTCNRNLTTRADKENTSTHIPNIWQSKLELQRPCFEWECICDPENISRIEKNILNRKGVGDIHKVQNLWHAVQYESDTQKKERLESELAKAALDIPNTSHPDAPIGDESCARLVDVVGTKKKFDFNPKTVVELGEKLDMLRTDNVAITTGTKSYYFKGDLVRLERALIRYTCRHLLAQGFQLVTVPDMIQPEVIEGCGFKTTGDRTQVYRLDPEPHGDVCMAGTSEMPLAGYFIDKVLDEKELPLKLAAVSRCYRAEAPDQEQGIYRVHQFTKVEMFGITCTENNQEGELMLQELVALETKLFSDLGLHFRILDMPSQELGAPAHRKFDIEAWMPAKQFWGEISSASNCLNYQSRRLNIQYKNSASKLKHATTVNGTACAIPRMIMAIFENFQKSDGSIDIPEPLRDYLNGQEKFTVPDRTKAMKWIKANKLRANS